MNKTQLVDCIQAKLGEGATKKCADAALSAVLGAISDAVKGGDKVQLIGFGTFEMKTRPERTGRNPQTGAEMTIHLQDCYQAEEEGLRQEVLQEEVSSSDIPFPSRSLHSERFFVPSHNGARGLRTGSTHQARVNRTIKKTVTPKQTKPQIQITSKVSQPANRLVTRDF